MGLYESPLNITPINQSQPERGDQEGATTTFSTQSTSIKSFN
jgi:hypothetical protein